MGKPENPIIATIDDVNAQQQTARAAARRLVDRLKLDPETARDLETIIRATARTQRDLNALRVLAHDRTYP